MTEFEYQEMFPLEKDATEYRLLSTDFVNITSFDGHDVVKIDLQALTLVAEEAFRDVSHLLRPAHLEKVAAILADPGHRKTIVWWLGNAEKCRHFRRGRVSHVPGHRHGHRHR
jgi:hypothetical protein